VFMLFTMFAGHRAISPPRGHPFLNARPGPWRSRCALASLDKFTPAKASALGGQPRSSWDGSEEPVGWVGVSGSLASSDWAWRASYFATVALSGLVSWGGQECPRASPAVP
jgi:hypothetical protein